MTSFQRAYSVAALLGAVVFSNSASAFTLKLDETLDLTKPAAIGTGYVLYEGSPAFGSAVSGSLAVGDTLDYTVDFAGTQSLSLANVQYLWGFIGAGASNSKVIGTGRLELLGADGSVLLTSNTKTDTEALDHFGQAFVSADFPGGLPATVTFYGIHYVGTVDSFTDLSPTRAFGTPGLEIIADNVSVPGVDEPANVALMLAGLGVVGLWRRRARARTA